MHSNLTNQVVFLGKKYIHLTICVICCVVNLLFLWNTIIINIYTFFNVLSSLTKNQSTISQWRYNDFWINVLTEKWPKQK